MVKVPLGKGDWERQLSKEPDIRLLNRYYEQNPTNLEEQAALLARPGLRKMLEVGEGPIRAVYSQPGTFDEALFVVSGTDLYKIDVDETITLIADNILDNNASSPSMAATSNIGSTPEFLYICEGGELWVYVEDGFAVGQMDSTGTISAGDDIQLGSVYYTWTSGSVDTGTPDGTSGNPWLVALGSDDAESIKNMFNAINATGEAGVTYSTDLVENPEVSAINHSADVLSVRAASAGLAGNGIATVATGANISFGSATLTGGGSPSLTTVPMPDDVGVVSVGYIASYVICVVTQGFGVNGRFYWIEPGESTVDPLNFATAERAPDPLFSVRVVGDQFWLLGTNSTEVWYPTGNIEFPFQRVQGRIFDRGIWEGTDVQIKDFVILVDNDGVVYKIGSGPERVSDHSIEERIRAAQTAEKLFTGGP